MANLPENTTNPILRPVTQLETTTKVYGGEYIPGDPNQRGISNLQAIELAERDQFILSRVGKASVPASGDIPAVPGIASLDSGGKLPDTQLPNGVTKAGNVQALTNKTLSSEYNTIIHAVTNVASSQTITPAALMSVAVTASGVTLTLGNGPYVGYSLPVFFASAGNIVYTGANGSKQVAMPALSKDTYTWTGAMWVSELDSRYPEGSIYASSVDRSPEQFMGGTWVQIKDRFLLCAGDTYAAGATGGEANHTLTENEMPTHSHELKGIQVSSTKSPCRLVVQDDGNMVLYGSNGSITWEAGRQSTATKSYRVVTLGIGSTDTGTKGSGQAHNNMPPYLAAYMWQRTA